ncbi:CobW family GTP-binding protein [Paenibacillus abyssi]|uniref:Cobalamin biosynthesis protein CobW n=1 Tax=Paenibacillus abyssi TaxID=1340531 RepID=A0A917LGJ4_9BACL|nr:GTP-binding protein [Paenibacillus abyssi]GGG22461.1 cobalamin biosynthesis protein CobW [Paenibacillus abyssi]
MAIGRKGKIPATIITGFLGAGKTTLLNRILSDSPGKKIAVIINEFGEIGIDNQLVIESKEEVIEMNNGCICCTVRGDLIRIVGTMVENGDAYDHIIVETTGLADPAPVLQSFIVDDVMRANTQLNAVITVVDSKHIVQHWDSTEVEEQLAFADVILLNKTDLVAPQDLDELAQRITKMNAMADILRSENCELDAGSLLHLGKFDLQNALSVDPNFLSEDAHEHDTSVYSISIAEQGAIDSDKLSRWLLEFLQANGNDIYRMKGVLNIDDEDRRYVFQGVHMTLDGRPGRPWGPGELRRNELVFIGRNLDEKAIREGVISCLANVVV